MRRSEWIAWLAVGGAYVVTLTTCDNGDAKPLEVPNKVAVYPDVKACMDDGKPQLVCATAMSSAVKTHFARAPRYTDRAACAQAHGPDGCTVVSPPGGADQFAPLMAGFVLGSALGVGEAVPVYYDRQGYARIVGGDYRLGKRCREDDKDCSGGGGGGGGSGGYTHYSKGKEWVDTSSGNMRSVSRGGFGHAVHGVSS